MCCTTTIGTGKPAGSFGKILESATGPPVDVPIDALGAFPDERRPRVAWAGPSAPVTGFGLLSDAGLTDVEVSELPVPLRAASFDEWWARTSALAGPLAKLLAALPDEAAQALRRRLQEATRPYETANGLEFPGVTLLAGGRRT